MEAELHDDLRAISDDLAADARHVEAIETAKSQGRLDDPKLETLAEESQRIIEEMAVKARAETALVKSATDS